MKTFAIIIVNFNCAKDTIETIRCLREFGDLLFDIYLIDNHSSSEDLNFLERNLSSDVLYIKSDKNLGFAGANNLAIKEGLQKKYKYFFLLNPDTLIDDKDFFETIEKEIDRTKADILGPLVLYYPEKEKVYFAGGFVNRCLGYSQMRGKGQKLSSINKEKNFECDFITGCSIIIKREVVEKIGLIPEEYFLYFEETDFCLSAKNSGFKIVFTPKTYVYHKVSSSIKYLSNTYLYYMVRNFRIFGEKYTKQECKIFFYFFYYFVWVAGYVFLGILKNKKFSSIKPILRALK